MESCNQLDGNSSEKEKNGVNADVNKEEYQYLDLIKKILNEGARKNDRTGVGTKSIFGTTMRFSLKNGEIPLITTKRVFWRGVVHELLWFISGSTDERKLSEVNVNIWKENSRKEYFSSIGLSHREEGDLGPVYGFQWRHYGAHYVDFNTDYRGQGVDQLKNVIDLIRNNPDSRRIIMSAWNPADLPQMALPPCHCLVQFYVVNDELSCQLYQRSADMGLGVPFNIASYSLLTYMIAHIVGLKTGEFIHVIGDAHVYLNHEKALREQLSRIPRAKPKLNFRRAVETIQDFTFEDIELIGYKPHPKIEMAMAV